MQDVPWAFPVAKLERWVVSLEETLERMDKRRHVANWQDLVSLKWELQAARQYAVKKQIEKGNEEITEAPTADDLLAYVVSSSSRH